MLQKNQMNQPTGKKSTNVYNENGERDILIDAPVESV